MALPSPARLGKLRYIKRFLPQKNLNFPPGTLMGNHLKIRQKPPPKPREIAQKMRGFCTSIKGQLSGGCGASRQKNPRF
jgi:hypothetical protein